MTTFNYPTTNDLSPKDVCWHEGRLVIIDTVEDIPAMGYKEAHWLVNKWLKVQRDYVWTRLPAKGEAPVGGFLEEFKDELLKPN